MGIDPNNNKMDGIHTPSIKVIMEVMVLIIITITIIIIISTFIKRSCSRRNKN